MRNPWFLCGMLSLALCTPFAWGETSSKDIQTQLNQINKRINAVENTLGKNQQQRKDLEKNLELMDLSLSDLNTQLRTVDKTLRLETTQLNLLKAQQRIYQQEISTEETHLGKDIQTAYLIGNQDYLRLLLNQNDSQAVARNLYYFKYLSTQKISLIQQLNHTLSELQANQKQIEHKTQTLLKLREQQLAQKTTIIKAQTIRQTLLTALMNTIQSNQDVLSALKSNKENLSNLIQSLQESQNPQPFSNSENIPFSQLRGRLPWPTQGPIVQHFNTPLYGSDLLSTGVVIEAPEGQNVYAVAPGKVLFSGWLKGFGLLMIIDQGEGYMSLYGRNQSLFKKTGQTVQAGDLIAEVGETGGFSQSGLYFELRQGASPQDPETWCLPH